jgi:hypothetical protein
VAVVDWGAHYSGAEVGAAAPSLLGTRLIDCVRVGVTAGCANLRERVRADTPPQAPLSRRKASPCNGANVPRRLAHHGLSKVVQARVDSDAQPSKAAVPHGGVVAIVARPAVWDCGVATLPGRARSVDLALPQCRRAGDASARVDPGADTIGAHVVDGTRIEVVAWSAVVEWASNEADALRACEWLVARVRERASSRAGSLATVRRSSHWCRRGCGWGGRAAAHPGRAHVGGRGSVAIVAAGAVAAGRTGKAQAAAARRVDVARVGRGAHDPVARVGPCALSRAVANIVGRDDSSVVARRAERKR